MSGSAEWETWRKQRTSGRVTVQEWLAWADRYVSQLPAGDWKKHCESHIRFVRRDAENNR